MDIQSLRDQAKEARQKAELQFLTMAAHGESLKKQQELQKDLLPKKPMFSLSARSPGGSRGLEMRRLQAEQMEKKLKDMKRDLSSREWYDGSSLRPQEESKLAEGKEKGDSLEEIFKFAKHAPPPPPPEREEPIDIQAKKASAAPEKAPDSRPKFPELSTLELPTTSAPRTQAAFGPAMKLSSIPPPSFDRNMIQGESDNESWFQDSMFAPPYGYSEMFPPPPPPMFQGSRKLRQEEAAGEQAEPSKSRHKSRRSKHHRSEGRSRRSKKEKEKETQEKDAGSGKGEAAKKGKERQEDSSNKDDKENKEAPADALKDVSEHSKRVASVHELEKERDSLRQDIALLAAAVQNRNQMPAHPPAPVIVQYPMPQVQEQPTAKAPAAPKSDPFMNGGAGEEKKGESNEDLMRMFNSAFNSGDIELKKYLQHEVLRLRKRNDLLEGERVDLLTSKAELKRITADFVAVKASLESVQSENASMKEENVRLQGLNDILAEEVKRGDGGGMEDTSLIEAELASLRLMNHKLKTANKDLLEEQRNRNNVENQLLGKIESLEATKTTSPVRKLENQIVSLQNENLEKEEELSELQERAAQIDRLREENANLELQLIELKMKNVQEIPIATKLRDASEEIGKLNSDNDSLLEQVNSLNALNDEIQSSKKSLEAKCAMYEKILQEAKLLNSGITMYDPTGQLVEKNRKELTSVVKDYIATEFELPQLRSSNAEVGEEGPESNPSKTSPAQSPHGKLIMQTGKENIQSYLVKASTRRDFMRMSKNENVKALLARSNDLEVEFSDLVFKREDTGMLKKFILVITKNALYLLTSDQYICEWNCAFTNLFSMGWDSQIVEDLSFKVANNVDMCIQSPRRDIVIGTILTLLEESKSSFQVKKDLSSFSLLRAV